MVLEEITTVTEINIVKDRPRQFLVVHPLDDVAEQKVDTTHLGPMRLTPAVRYSLLALRAYMFLMVAMVCYYVWHLAGVFTRG